MWFKKKYSINENSDIGEIAKEREEIMKELCPEPEPKKEDIFIPNTEFDYRTLFENPLHNYNWYMVDSVNLLFYNKNNRLEDYGNNLYYLIYISKLFGIEPPEEVMKINSTCKPLKDPKFSSILCNVIRYDDKVIYVQNYGPVNSSAALCDHLLKNIFNEWLAELNNHKDYKLLIEPEIEKMTREEFAKWYSYHSGKFFNKILQLYPIFKNTDEENAPYIELGEYQDIILRLYCNGHCLLTNYQPGIRMCVDKNDPMLKNPLMKLHDRIMNNYDILMTAKQKIGE